MNQVVAHYLDGRLVKGTTNNFLPGKDLFHLLASGQTIQAKPTEVLLVDLKALFFVKDLRGNPNLEEKTQFDPGKVLPGRKIRVVFKDGEVLVGTTQGYQPGRPGFFVVPLDERSNNERCFIVSSSTQAINLL